MALLPEELRRPQEQARAQLPPDDVRPLVDEQRQVTVALHPRAERLADDRLRRGANDERLLELRIRIGDEAAVRARDEAVVRDDGALLREALDVLGLFFEEALGDEQRKVRVLVAGVLEHAVERALDVLPDRVAPRLDHHAAADVGILGEVGALHDLLVPLRVIFAAGRSDCGLGGHGGKGSGVGVQGSASSRGSTTRRSELAKAGHSKRLPSPTECERGERKLEYEGKE